MFFACTTFKVVGLLEVARVNALGVGAVRTNIGVGAKHRNEAPTQQQVAVYTNTNTIPLCGGAGVGWLCEWLMESQRTLMLLHHTTAAVYLREVTCIVEHSSCFSAFGCF